MCGSHLIWLGLTWLILLIIMVMRYSLSSHIAASSTDLVGMGYLGVNIANKRYSLSSHIAASSTDLVGMGYLGVNIANNHGDEVLSIFPCSC